LARHTFHGFIDEVQVYSRPLDATEVQALSDAGTAGVCKCQDRDGDGFPAAGASNCPGNPAVDCDDGNPAVHPGATDTNCNGVDDNCSGIADEGYVPISTICGVGACTATGESSCVAGQIVDTCVPHAPVVESCNAIDDNCNGQIDEDTLGVDSDGDGIHNACDNCRFVANTTQIDGDGDHVGNACDNCINTSNANQSDADADGRGDTCDNCLTVPNGFQDDTDADRVGDACDNCSLDYNPTQSDFNHDGEGDICDLNDGLIYVYSTDKNYREWQAEAGYTTWNSYRGSLAVLRATGQYTQAPGSNTLAAHDCGVSDPYVFDIDVPGPGEVAFNLVTGVAGGVESSLGTNSAGVRRPNANPCP